MHRHVWLILAAVAMLAVMPAFAGHGGDHSKCKYSTQDCLDHMANQMKNSGWVGVELDTENPDGYEVSKVIPGSPAEAAGIQAGDVLVALNGVPLNKDNDEEMAKARKEWKPGQTVTYTVRRNGGERQVTLTLGTWPADTLAKMIGMHMLEHANAEEGAKK
jgi:C-terminal processing protease CtpA/Prc